jgi:hypothetical protein
VFNSQEEFQLYLKNWNSEASPLVKVETIKPATPEAVEEIVVTDDHERIDLSAIKAGKLTKLVKVDQHLEVEQ